MNLKYKNNKAPNRAKLGLTLASYPYTTSFFIYINVSFCHHQPGFVNKFN